MLQVRLLAQFDVRVDGRRVVIPARAAQSLFAYLVLNSDAAHRREKLAGLLWPEMSEESARHNLRHELWRLRKAIATQQSLDPSPDKPGAVEYIHAEEFTIAFNSQAEYWLDVAQLLREQPNLSTGELIAQVGLYRGDLLPGFYDDWVAFERERVQTVFERKMQVLLERLIAEQQWSLVLEWAERWIALGDTPEPAYRALMVAHGAAGETSQVALAYERCAEALRNELSVEPSTETRALYEKLTRGDETTRAIVAPLPSILVQPSGTVTFLFSDIEGSTNLLEQLGGDYAALLAEHHDLLREVAEKYNGHEVDTQGDAFFFAFFRAADAVSFAADAQKALAAHKWPRETSLRVRMGLHTGEPMLARTGYVGMDVHRAARIGAAGHGGQVLMSRTTRDLVENDLPSGTHLTDLGEHKLKDLRYPVHIVQLTIDSLPSDFPPLKVLNTGSEPPAPGEPPFKGLQYFDESDAALFFGREALVDKLVQDLNERQFLAVIVGASGSGKSSVVRAGLIPAIRRDVSPTRLYVITPTAHPLQALATELTRDSESVTATATLIDDMARDPRSLHLYLLRRMTDDPSPRSGQAPRTTDSKTQSSSLSPQSLLVVDQFEELFTLCHDDLEREQFIDNLLFALSPSTHQADALLNSTRVPARPPSPSQGERRRGEGLTLILTLRADFYAHLAQYPELRDAVAKGQEYIGPMTNEELRRAIQEPAKQQGAADGSAWEFEPGLVDLMLRDVGDEPGALPLLSHALLETWKRRSGHLMTLKGYADAGGVRGAIAHTADTTYQELSPEEQQIARAIFLRLTELGEATEDTRRRASYAELIPQGKEGAATRAVLTRLADARLITTGEESAEVAHEALIREWPRLREWLNQDRDGLRLHRQITEAAQEWELLERDPGALYRGMRLAQAREFQATNPDALNAQERAFLDASVENEKKEEREKQEQQERELAAAQKLAAEQQARAEESSRANQRLRQRALILAGVMVLALLAAAAAAFFGNRANENAFAAEQNALAADQNAQAAEKAREEAEQQERVALARELAANATSNLTVDTERSILLALQAISATAPDKLVMPEAVSALHRAVFASRALKTLTGHTNSVFGVTFNPNGTQFATVSIDGTTRVWDARTWQELFQFRHPEGFAFNVIYNKDGKRIATIGGKDESTTQLEIHDALTGELIKATSLPMTWKDFAFNALDPEWERLALTTHSGAVQVIDAETGKDLFSLSSGVRQDLQVAFSPDGNQLATSTSNGSATIWDLGLRTELFTFPYNDQVTGLAYSPDGTRLAVGSYDNTASIWDAVTGKELFKFEPRIGQLNSIAWNADGTQLAAVGWNRIALVWDANTGTELARFYGHDDRIQAVAFSPDGEQLVTTSGDDTVKVWSLAPEAEVWTVHSKDFLVGLVEYSPDGTKLLLSKTDKAVVLDAATGKQLFELGGHKGWVPATGFSPDGTMMATGDGYGTVKLWETATGKELQSFSKGGGGFHLSFSPDNSQLATAAGQQYQIWDLATEKLLHTFETHGFHSFAFSPDSSVFAGSTADGETTVWELPSGTPLFKLTDTNPSALFDVQFSPDGKKITTANGNGTAQIWDAQTGKELVRLSKHDADVSKSVFTRDGKQVVTAGSDGTLKVWDAETGTELFTIPINQGTLYGLAIHSDGSRVATASDHAVYVVTLHIDDLVALAKAKLTRTWREDECQKYLHLDKCP